jgi:hypothetical protein
MTAVTAVQIAVYLVKPIDIRWSTPFMSVGTVLPIFHRLCELLLFLLQSLDLSF